MKRDIILSGVGGQGILSIATVIGAAALKEGLHIKQAEVHGMSQRGGDVQSNLRISSDEILSDLIPQGAADIIISLEPMEALRYVPYLNPEGWVIANTTPFVNIDNYPEPEAVLAELGKRKHAILIDVDAIAKEQSSPRAANIVLLGAAAPFLGLDRQVRGGHPQHLRPQRRADRRNEPQGVPRRIRIRTKTPQVMAALIPQKMFDEQLAAMDIENFAQATIRQVGAVGGALEKNSGTEFLHLEMGVPGLPPETVGVEAEQQALAQGHASIYPSITGIAPLKSEASRFVKAFLDIDVAPEGCIPTVGSMQGGFCLFQISSQCDPKKDTILFIDPGFPVQRQQVRILGIKHESFDIYDFRAEKLGPKLESYLKQGNVAAIIYSNPNNPAWICLTESELRTIGELATRYDTIVLEDLAYMGMDFRKELGHPFQAPFQATAARYTDNYVLMISGSKIFSYAGQRIAIAAISDKLRNRFYPALKERYGIGRFAESYALTFLYAASSGASHSAQYALAAMFKAAADGKLDFVGHTREYAHRAHRVKELFERHGFHIVYDKDQNEHVSDGFFFTVGYGSMPSSDLVAALLRYGICAISLTSTGSLQNGVRVCVSQMNREEQYDLLDRRLRDFAQDYARK